MDRVWPWTASDVTGGVSLSQFRGHVKTVHSLLTLGARTLPRHCSWRPSILGRSNMMDYLLDLLGEDDIQDIHTSMVGRQTRLLVSVGQGFYGIAGKVVEALTPRDISDNFLLLRPCTGSHAVFVVCVSVYVNKF